MKNILVILLISFTSLSMASDGSRGDIFGSFVSISGNKVILGAPGIESGTGAAYIFVPE
ncbi:TPA: FG-GAP repeat protein [Vibrio parahaemolyticus]|nr:FG-GAP repeat protein [Vibrio parahaemolyticus]